MAGTEDQQGAADPHAESEPAPGVVDDPTALVEAQQGKQPYRIVRELGRGSKSILYEATDLLLDRTVTLKMPLPGQHQEGTFLEEARITARLEHPNIIAIHDWGHNEDGRPFYAMDRIEGTDLAADLASAADKPPSRERLNRLLSTLLKACDAVAFAHSRGVVHADLNPGSILVGNYGEVLVTNWGTALSGAVRKTASRRSSATLRAVRPPSGQRRSLPRTKDNQPHASTEEHAAPNAAHQGHVPRGTPGYMAPEQIASPEELHDERIDVFTLGAILYTILTGAPPTAATTPAAHLAALQRRPPRPPELVRPDRAIPPELSAIAMTALARQPEGRYPSVAAFQQDLAAYLAGEPVSVCADTVPRLLIRLARRHRTTLFLAGVALALIAGSVGLAFLFNQMEQQRAELLYSELAELEAHHQTEQTALATIAAERQEQWLPVFRTDFGASPILDTRFKVRFCPAPLAPDRQVFPLPPEEAVSFSEGLLHLHGQTSRGGGLVSLAWSEALAEHLRLELTLPSNQCFGLAIGGDSFNGYRVIFDLRQAHMQHRVELDTIREGVHTVLAHNYRPIDTEREHHRIRIEKSGGSLKVHVNGIAQIEHFTPLPFSGPGQRTFALSAFWAEARFESLAVWRRRAPERIPVLEIGRVLLRRRLFAEATAFFAAQHARFGATPLGQEAQLLLGLSHQLMGRTRQALDTYTDIADAAPIFAAEQGPAVRLHDTALDLAAGLQAAQHRWTRAVDLALRLQHSGRGKTTADSILSQAVRYLQSNTRQAPETASRYRRVSTLAPGELDEVLAALVRLPIRHWPLNQIGLINLEPLRAATVEHLHCAGNRLTSLAPLHGQPLSHLNCQNNLIADLRPLARLPLESLNCVGNRIADLAPLQRCPLLRLYCTANAITNLAPLRDLPLRELACGGNAIASLSPLGSLKLTHLQIPHTPVRELGDLHGMPLRSLDISHTAVTDLSPLAGMPLRRLYIQESGVTDVRPLRDLPLEILHFSPWHITAGLEVLRRHPTLQRIGINRQNQFTTETFWARLDQGEWQARPPGREAQ